MSGACFTVGAFTTHGLAGYLRYSGQGGDAPSEADRRREWRFWQPFQGGAGFVATQVGGRRAGGTA